MCECRAAKYTQRTAHTDLVEMMDHAVHRVEHGAVRVVLTAGVLVAFGWVPDPVLTNPAG